MADITDLEFYVAGGLVNLTIAQMTAYDAEGNAITDLVAVVE